MPKQHQLNREKKRNEMKNNHNEIQSISKSISKPTPTSTISYSNCTFNYGKFTNTQNAIKSPVQHNYLTSSHQFHPYSKHKQESRPVLAIKNKNKFRDSYKDYKHKIDKTKTNQSTTFGKNYDKKIEVERHALCEFWSHDDLGSFIEFLLHEKLPSYLPRLYEKCTSHEMGNLLNDFYSVLTEENFESFQSKFCEAMSQTCPSFHNDAQSIFAEL